MSDNLSELQTKKRELVELHAQLTEDIMAIKSQLKEYEEHGTVRGRPIDDPNWAIRARDARKHNVAHFNHVQAELGIVKKQIANWHLKKSVPHAFYQAAGELLPREVFAKILQQAQANAN